MAIRKMYSVFDNRMNMLYPEYVESRSTSEKGWLALFYKCYPDSARGMHSASIKMNGAEILNNKKEVVVTFEQLK